MKVFQRLDRTPEFGDEERLIIDQVRALARN